MTIAQILTTAAAIIAALIVGLHLQALQLQRRDQRIYQLRNALRLALVHVPENLALSRYATSVIEESEK